MQQGFKLTTTSRMKLVTGLLLMALTLLLVSGAAPAGVVLDRAGAQEEVPGGAAEAPADEIPGEVPEPPETGAVSWAIMDENSGEFLVGQEPDEQLPIGSVTKIMAALVVMQEGTSLDEEVPISGEAESYVGGVFSNVGLIAEERVTVRDLLVASLVASGTEAVYALAEHVGDGSVEQFVGMMNEEASRLGLENTNFDTPAGLDTEDNYSSARDLAILSREVLQEPLLAEIVDTPEATISTQGRQIEITNTNQLLNTYPPATGIKTGTTPEAGANLAASAESNDESFITIVIGAEDSDQRFLAAESLLEYAFERYERRPLVNQDEVYGEAPLPYRPNEAVQLAATGEVAGLVDADSDVERRVTILEELPPSASAGDELGEVELLVNGRRIGESPLVAQEGYEEASLWQKTRSTVGGLLESVQGAISGLTSGE